MTDHTVHRGFVWLIGVLCCFGFSDARLVDRTLALKQPRYNEKIGLQEIMRYNLNGLQAGAEYEVRVSYPATIPMHIHFSWQYSGDTDQKYAWRSRQLLNLEKVMFRTDKRGMPPGLLLLTVSSEGVHVNGPNEGPATLLFNIELAPVSFGIPNAAFPVIIFLLLGLLAIFVALPKLHKAFLPWVARWISGRR